MSIKKRRAWSKIQTHVLAYGKTIGLVNTFQTGALQTDTEAHVDGPMASSYGEAGNRATSP
jgi:hypothetical protein